MAVPVAAAIPASSAVAPLSKRAKGRSVNANGNAATRPTRQNHAGAIPIANATGNQTAVANVSPMPHALPRRAAIAPPMSSSDARTVIQRSNAMLLKSVRTLTTCTARRERRTRRGSTSTNPRARSGARNRHGLTSADTRLHGHTRCLRALVVRKKPQNHAQDQHVGVGVGGGGGDGDGAGRGGGRSERGRSPRTDRPQARIIDVDHAATGWTRPGASEALREHARERSRPVHRGAHHGHGTRSAPL